MQKFIRWIIGAPIVILVIAFAIANRRWVTLSFDPFSQEAPKVYFDMPLWLLFFAGVFVGIVVGWIGSWFAQSKWRKAARNSKAEVAQLQKELADVRKQSTPLTSNHREIATHATDYPWN